MKRSTCVWSILALTFLWLRAAQAAGPEISALTKPQVVEAYGHLPLSFEANQGQTDQRVRFLVRGSGYSLFLTANEAVLALKKKAALPAVPLPASASLKDNFELRDQARISNRESPAVLLMRLVGANHHARVTGLEELPGKSNYFIGNDPKKWRTNVPNYAKVKYANVYPGVDLVYYGNQRQLEYDFVVQPGADPNAIKLLFAGDLPGEQATPIRVDGNGDLVVDTGDGEAIFHKPLVYQSAPERGQRARDAVDGKYLLKGNRVAFEVASYDKTRPLVIDPTLAYSTYLGGDGAQGFGIAVDAAGNAYVTGSAGGGFPTTPGTFHTTCGGGPVGCSDAFISKLNATGSALVYSTYLGGSGLDEGFGIAVDSSGNTYVTGLTNSSDFPTTPGAFQTNSGAGCPGHFDFSGCDAFVIKLNTTGSALLYSTYLGGSGGAIQFGSGIAVDASGNAYVTGSSNSSDFPTTPGAFQTTFAGNVDVFISKLNATGSALVYSTYLGGSDFDQGKNIALDASGNSYVTGVTASSNFPTTPGAFQTTYGGGGDAFISKLNATGSALIYSTYLGGSDFDGGVGVAVDASDDAYVTGVAGLAFPTTPGAFQTTYGGNEDAFVTKLNAAGSALIYSTYLGGDTSEQGNGIAIDASRNAYVTGFAGPRFPTTADAFQAASAGSFDVFVSKLNATGSALIYSTYLGGSGDDEGQGIAIDASGHAAVAGTTVSPGPLSFDDFPTTLGAFQTSFGGGANAFVARFSFGIGPPTHKAQCKNGGWKVFTIPRKFKNQGDCVSFVNTGK